jgi:GAF domain-containing protein
MTDPPDSPDAGRWSQLSPLLHEQQSPAAMLQTVLHTVSGAEFAGLTVVEPKQRLRTVAATDELVTRIDQAQYRTMQGPCLDALWVEPVVSMPDIRAEQRWPKFTDAVHRYGLRSMLSLRLFTANRQPSSLNLYATSPRAFSDESIDTGRAFVTHAAVAWASAERIAQLQHALAHRDIIGQAKGILMERHKITADQAFQLLVTASQNAHRKLHEIARDVSDSGIEPLDLIPRAPGS